MTQYAGLTKPPWDTAIAKLRVRRAPAYVYWLWDKEGLPIYVGMTRYLKQRLQQHSSRAWKDDGWAFWDVTAIPALSVDNATQMEKDMIRTLQPKNNSVMFKNRSEL